MGLKVARRFQGQARQALGISMVRLLLRLRDMLGQQEGGEGLNTQAEAARAEVVNAVNNFFYERLTAIPTIKEYMDNIQQK